MEEEEEEEEGGGSRIISSSGSTPGANDGEKEGSDLAKDAEATPMGDKVLGVSSAWGSASVSGADGADGMGGADGTGRRLSAGCIAALSSVSSTAFPVACSMLHAGKGGSFEHAASNDGWPHPPPAAWAGKEGGGVESQ